MRRFRIFTQIVLMQSCSRVTPIIAVADLGMQLSCARDLTVAGWEITTHSRFQAVGSAAYSGGNHGFDPEYMDMKPIFIGAVTFSNNAGILT